jgi:hypothetical protein
MGTASQGNLENALFLVWHQWMFSQMFNGYHKVEIGKGFEQVNPVREGITKRTVILPRV